MTQAWREDALPLATSCAAALVCEHPDAFRHTCELHLWHSHKCKSNRPLTANKKDRHKTCQKIEATMAWREDTFSCENELRQGLCLQADKALCLACELHSRRSHEGKLELSPTTKEKILQPKNRLQDFWRGNTNLNRTIMR